MLVEHSCTRGSELCVIAHSKQLRHNVFVLTLVVHCLASSSQFDRDVRSHADCFGLCIKSREGKLQNHLIEKTEHASHFNGVAFGVRNQKEKFPSLNLLVAYYSERARSAVVPMPPRFIPPAKPKRTVSWTPSTTRAFQHLFNSNSSGGL